VDFHRRNRIQDRKPSKMQKSAQIDDAKTHAAMKAHMRITRYAKRDATPWEGEDRCPVRNTKPCA
jgi:hypothetical protein